MIYYSILGCLSFFSLSRQVNHQLFNKLYSCRPLIILISFFPFVIIGGLRYEVGADWGPYQKLFDRLADWRSVFEAREEILFSGLMFIIKSMFHDFSIFIFVLFLVSFSLKYSIIRRYSPDIFVSLMVYLYTVFLIYDVNGLRQGLAIGIVLHGVPYILKRKLLPFLALTIMASFFHISALIFVPLYYLARIQISNKILMLSLIPLIVISLQIGSVLQHNSIFQSFLEIERFLHYATYLTDAYHNANESFLNIALFQRLFIFLLFMYYYKKIMFSEDIKLLLRNGYFASIIIFIIFSFSSEFSARLGFYYKSLEILIIPMLVSCPIKRSERLMLLGVFIVFCLFGIYRLLSLPFEGYLLPYKNILLLDIV